MIAASVAPIVEDSQPRQNETETRDPSPCGRAKTATVCQVLHSLEVGGAEMLANRIARQLSSQFRFVFACLDGLGTLGEELAAAGFKVEVLDRKPGLDRRCMKRLMSLVRSERVDIIHAHQYTPFFYALAAGLGRRRPPVLFTEHGRWFPDFPRRKRILFNRLFLRRGDRVVAVGNSVKRALIENEGIPENRIQVIYNGIDIARYGAEHHNGGAVRDSLGLSRDDFVIIQVARLDPLKDHLTAVRTMHRVIQSVPAARLLIVGAGPEEAKIRAEVQRLGLDNQVRLLGLRHDIPRLLAAADTFLLTSISEGIPLTVIEAMAAGLPVVSTDVGGIGEIVEHNATGYLAPAGDHAALADALVNIVASSDRRARFATVGQRRAAERFSESQMMDAYHRLYDEILVN
jgi:N-acetyl-alpha-D-glucosaminyl L-malate synthase BshA